MSDQELIMLAILSETERYGYEIYRIIRERPSGFGGEFALSSVYAVLTRLQRRGLLASREVLQTGKPPRKLYQISPSGRTELERALSQAINPNNGILGKFELILIVWPILSDEKRKSLLTDYHHYLKSKSDYLEGLAREEINPISAARFERPLFAVNAEIRWLKDFSARNGIEISGDTIG